MNRSLRSRLLSLLSGLSLTAALAAQQTVCLSLHGVATGANNLGQPAQVAARVQGVHVAVPTAPGQGAPAASAAHEAAFAAAGFIPEPAPRRAPADDDPSSAPAARPLVRYLWRPRDPVR